MPSNDQKNCENPGSPHRELPGLAVSTKHDAFVGGRRPHFRLTGDDLAHQILSSVHFMGRFEVPEMVQQLYLDAADHLNLPMNYLSENLPVIDR